MPLLSSVSEVSSRGYTNLLSDVQEYLDRYDSVFVSKIPGFIENAQTKIFNALSTLLTSMSTTISYTSEGEVCPILTYPSGWRSTVSMSCNNRVIAKVNYEYIFSYANDWANNASKTSTYPIYYADIPTPTSAGSTPTGFSFTLGPPLTAGDYTIGINYQGNNYVNSTNETNLITQYAYPMLLYGALLDANLYLKNDERIPLFKALYDEQVKSHMDIDRARIVDKSALREKMD